MNSIRLTKLYYYDSSCDKRRSSFDIEIRFRIGFSFFAIVRRRRDKVQCAWISMLFKHGLDSIDLYLSTACVIASHVLFGPLFVISTVPVKRWSMLHALLVFLYHTIPYWLHRLVSRHVLIFFLLFVLLVVSCWPSKLFPRKDCKIKGGYRRYIPLLPS